MAVIAIESRHVILLMRNRMMNIIGRGDPVVLLEISEDDREKKGMQNKGMLTTGLAIVATVHAANNISKSVGRRKKRQQQLEDGEISPEEARKRKIKSNVMDAASAGLAALGIGEAVMEWKEAHEVLGEHRHFKKKCKERGWKRAERRARSRGDSYSSRKSLSNDSYDRDDSSDDR